MYHGVQRRGDVDGGLGCRDPRARGRDERSVGHNSCVEGFHSVDSEEKERICRASPLRCIVEGRREKGGVVGFSTRVCQHVKGRESRHDGSDRPSARDQLGLSSKSVETYNAGEMRVACAREVGAQDSKVGEGRLRESKPDWGFFFLSRFGLSRALLARSATHGVFWTHLT